MSEGNRDEIADQVKDIVSDHMGVARDKLTEESNFLSDLGADSLDIVELIMEFEEKFDINIPDDEAEKIQTVGNAIDYVASHVKAS